MRSIMKKYLSIWIGLTIALIYKFNALSADGYPPFNQVHRILPNGTFALKSPEDFNSPQLQATIKPVVFITTTDYSPLQSALLTRLAQALYPVRNIVEWVVVSLPIETSPGYRAKVGNYSKEDIERNLSLSQAYRDGLHKLLGRFGVPYILLSSDKRVRTFWGGDKGRDNLLLDTEEERLNDGYKTGLYWAVRFLSEGVILVGNEDLTYNSILFHEVTKTKIASCWSVGLHPLRNSSDPNKLIFERRADNPKHLKVLGYKSGAEYKFGNIFIQRGGFAMDLQYMRDNIPSSDQWKLAMDREFTTDDIDLKLADIQVILNGRSEEDDESKILVWSTKFGRPELSEGTTDNSRMLEVVNDN